MKGKKVEKTNLASDDVYGMTSHFYGRWVDFWGEVRQKLGLIG